MPISLPSTATPAGLRSTYATDEENAAAAAAMQQDVLQENTAFGRGLSRGLYQTPAMVANAAGQIIEPFSAGTAQPMFDWAAQQNAAAQKIVSPNDPRSYDDVHSLGDAAAFIGGAFGENLPQMPLTVGGAMMARMGLRGAAMSPMAKNFVGASASSFPMVMGENVGELRADPTAMANTTAMQRLGNTAGTAALQAPLDAVGDALLMGRAGGLGKTVSNVFKDGIGKTAKDAALHVAKAVPEAALTEGLPEAGQEFIKQQMMGNVNPNRDTSHDEHAIKDSFFKGWAAGGPMSAVGRGADIAWAQGRGATDAIRELISPKALPENLKNSDDQSIVDWDKQDDAKRNETAKSLADRILDSDAAQSMKEAATSFYEKAASGASDAWSSLSQAVSENETYQSARASADRFSRSVKAANKAAFGEKFNAESVDPEADKAIRDAFDTHVDRNIYNAKFDGGTDVANKLFSDMKTMLAPGHDLTATEVAELGQHFGGKDGVEKAVNAMRAEMVRHAMVEHDDKFADMFKQTHATKLQEMQALTDIVKRYSPYGGKLTDREAAKYAKHIYDNIRADDTDVGAKKGEKGYEKRLAAKQQFVADTKSFFGGNYEKAIEAFRPKNDSEQKFETETNEGNITGEEVSQPKPRFVGSATKSASSAAASNPGVKETIEDHGGFWRLDKASATPEVLADLKSKIADLETKIVDAKAKGRGHKQNSAQLHKLNKQLSGMRTEDHVKQDRARMAAVSRGLRQGKGAEAHYVKHLTPIEYAEAAGSSKEAVAKHLGVTVEELEDHPARMIQVAQRQLEKDKLSLDKDDLENLAKSTEQALKDLPADVLLKGSQLARVRGALNKGGREARELLAEENLEHGVSMRGDRLVNNWHHGGNGVFTVHMKDGKQFTMTAQVLIDAMRKRAAGDMGDASALSAFSTGVAALQAIQGFDKITVNDLWGKPQAPSKNQIGDGDKKKTKANEQFGVFGPYFKLEPGMTLSSARSSEVRRKSKSETEEEAAIEEYEAIEEYMMAELNLRNLKHREEKAIKDGNTALAKFTAEKIPAIEQRMNELADQFPIVTDKEARSARIDELEENYDELEQKRELYSGENSGSEEPGLKDVSNKDTVTPLEHAGEPKRDYNDDGTRKHAPGKTIRLKKDERDLLRAKHQLEMAKVKLAKGLATQKDVTNAQNKVDRLMSQLEGSVGKSEDRTTRSTYNGQVLNLRPGVRAKDLTGEARKLISSVKALRAVIGNTATSDIVMNLMGQVAAANKAGDTVARDALLAMASDKIVETVVDEMLIAQETKDSATYKALKDIGSEHIALSKKYKANKEQMDEYAMSYLPFLGKKPTGAQAKKFEAAPERWSHHNQFLATLESKTDAEILADGIARKARIERLEALGIKNEKMDELIALMRQEQDIARDELRARKEGTKAQKIEEVKVVGRPDPVAKLPEARTEADRAERAAKGTKTENELEGEKAAAEGRAEREAKAVQHQQAFEQALTDVEKLKKNLGDTGAALRAAWDALKQSYVDGQFSKDLVPQLRAALAAFRAAVGDAARIVVATVQRFIKEYQEAGVPTDEVVLETKLNAESSQPTGQGVTKQDMADIKDYITKVLGPNVELRLAKALGGNSASWQRKPNGEALIKIAVNAANPLSKAHHEAMHEFFQRLLDDGSPAAEVLRQAANNPLVTRQIEQFFHSNANYAAIKSAIANDEHERVAYMFQLWAAGKLKVGPKTESWFQKIVSFLREVSGVLSNDQKAEAIMANFHDGKMSDSNAVAEVLANDPKLVKDLMTRGDEVMNPLAQKLKELMYTSQNILTESGNKSFEKIGRLFSTETGRQNEAMSFFDAKTMKTNQMNDRLVQILKTLDPKDVEAALEGLQQGKISNDPKIAAAQKRIHRMLDQIHDYMKDAGIKVKKVKDYFPRSWDAGLIADNKAKFVAMLQADHLKNTGKKMSDPIANGIAEKLIEGRGAEPVNENELENGYTPFMAASNKRVLDFISDPAFSEFQQKDMGNILSTYIAQAVHRVEYTSRFGENGLGLRSMVQDGVGEAVGPEWATARKAAETTLKNLKDQYKTAGMTADKIKEKLHEKGYRYGGVQIEHIRAELTTPEAKQKFVDFEPQLRRTVRAIMAMEGTLGADVNPALRKLSSTLIVYENLRLLSMSLFSQVIDPLGVLVRGGTFDDAFTTFKTGIQGTVAAWRGKPIENSMWDTAMKLGIIDAGNMVNSQGNTYASVYLGKTAQRINDTLFRVNGVEGFSQGTRVGATQAAINFLKYHSTLPDKQHSERWLAELNLKASDVTVVDGQLDLNNPKIQQAVFRWVETAILRPNAAMRPAWASDPHFALIFHMKQFTYAMQKVLLERVHNEAKHGNLDPGITMVLTYVPAMMAADFLRGLAANGGEEPPWKRKWTFSDYLTSGVQRAGLLGVPQLALDVKQWGPAELAGPAGEQVFKTAEQFHKDVKRDHMLDMKAATSGLSKDYQKAYDFNGVEHAAKKTLRDALPINSIAKHYVFDEVIGKP